MNKMKSVRQWNVMRQNIIQFILLLAIVILLNIIGRYIFTRFDLTTEKRFTLSKQTKELIRNLDDIVFFRVYLEGDLPPQYRRLRNETRTMLNEFRSYGKNNIQFEFIDITADKDRRAIHQIVDDLGRKGITPVVDVQGKGSEMSQKIIIPAAIATYREREIPVPLLVTSMGPGSSDKESIVNSSIQALEFRLADAIRKLTVVFRPKVAFIEGHGELSPLETAEAQRLLSEYYNVERVIINGQLNALDGFRSIVIARPDSAFSDKDKYIIDQFVMRGGSVLWLIDAVYADMDSLRNANETVAYSKRLNLEDMLFTWGVRINTDLVMDINGAPIPIMTGMVGDQPQFEFFTWHYFPLILSNQLHPIVKNLNPVKMDFVSSLDTVGGKGIQKTVLLTTSKFSRKVNTPATISLDILDQDPDRKLYNKQHIPVAILLEGEFQSVFHNRLPPEISENPEMNYRHTSLPAKMIVVSDGDLIRNQYVYRDGRYSVYPLGFDRFTNTTYGNSDFFLNAMNYLCDENNLLEIRSRELKIRLLDKEKISNERLKWQFINLLLPVVFVIGLGIILSLVRRQMYTNRI
jgi:ABC-2 type transport system permease protein